MKTVYNTTRKTIVERVDQMNGHATLAPIANDNTKKGTFDLLESRQGFVLVDACVPVKMAKLFKMIFDQQ